MQKKEILNKKRWIVLSIMLMLLLYGNEYEISYFYNDNASISDYFYAIGSSFLYFLYIIPIGFLLYYITNKLGVDKKFIIISFICGLNIPGFLSAIFNDYSIKLLEPYMTKQFYEDWALAFTAPFVEEIIKMIVVFACLYLWNKKTISDYFMAGFAVGFGFQIMEDFAYIGTDGLSDINQLVPMVLSRVSGSLSSHWTYTSLFALGSYFIKNKEKILSGICLIMIVFVNHFLWDSPLGETEYGPSILGFIMIISLIYCWQKYFLIECNKMRRINEKYRFISSGRSRCGNKKI